MKNYIYILVATILVSFAISCGNSSNISVGSFTFEGKVTDAKENEMICLSYPIKRGDVWYEQIDTTYIKDGKFHFSGKTHDIVPASLSLENMDCVEIYIGPSHMEFRANRNSLYDYSLTGTGIDNELSIYREYFAEYNRMAYECHHRVQRKNEEWVEASDAGLESANTLLAEFYALIAEYKALAATWPNMAVKFIEDHPNYKIIPNLIDCLIRYEGEIVSFQRLWDRLSNYQRQCAMGELLSLRYKFTTIYGGKVGCTAFDFDLEEFNGGSVQLSELNSSGYVLLDFWASWCSPCIGEIPVLQGFYDTYRDKVQIVSLSIDEDKEQWRKAVSKYNLHQWPQLFVSKPKDVDSYYFREQVDLPIIYGVDMIPCFILIDEQGVIVGRWTHLTSVAIDEIQQIVCKEQALE